jgi:hypothetical protein
MYIVCMELYHVFKLHLRVFEFDFFFIKIRFIGLKFWKFELKPIPKELAKVFEMSKLGLEVLSFKEEVLEKIGSY